MPRHTAPPGGIELPYLQTAVLQICPLLLSAEPCIGIVELELQGTILTYEEGVPEVQVRD